MISFAIGLLLQMSNTFCITLCSYMRENRKRVTVQHRTVESHIITYDQETEINPDEAQRLLRVAVAQFKCGVSNRADIDAPSKRPATLGGRLNSGLWTLGKFNWKLSANQLASFPARPWHWVEYRSANKRKLLLIIIIQDNQGISLIQSS